MATPGRSAPGRFLRWLFSPLSMFRRPRTEEQRRASREAARRNRQTMHDDADPAPGEDPDGDGDGH